MKSKFLNVTRGSVFIELLRCSAMVHVLWLSFLCFLLVLAFFFWFELRISLSHFGLKTNSYLG